MFILFIMLYYLFYFLISWLIQPRIDLIYPIKTYRRLLWIINIQFSKLGSHSYLQFYLQRYNQYIQYCRMGLLIEHGHMFLIFFIFLDYIYFKINLIFYQLIMKPRTWYRQQLIRLFNKWKLELMNLSCCKCWLNFWLQSFYQQITCGSPRIICYLGKVLDHKPFLKR